MTKKEAYSMGQDHAADPIAHNDCQRCAFASEEHSRQYTPFESTAREFNSLPEDGRDSQGQFACTPEDAWSAFDAGIADVIQGSRLPEECPSLDCQPGCDPASH